MVVINNRTRRPQAITINGVDAGGVMQANILAGWENRISATPDGMQLPVSDREIQYVRGTIVTQDWTEIVNLLTGAVGTYVCYERKSGAPEATGYVKYTITNPIIGNARLSFRKGSYATCTVSFECKAADTGSTISDMFAADDGVAAPTYISAARGGFRILSAVHGSTSIVHVNGFEFSLNIPNAKACNDGDVAYTAVDQLLDAMTANGSISFEDGKVTAGTLVAAGLLTATRANLVFTIRQSEGATNKTITIAGVEFDQFGNNADSGAEFTERSLSYEVTNSSQTPLTLAGTNKIIAIA